jgi:glucose/arabinose dehydrogenase
VPVGRPRRLVVCSALAGTALVAGGTGSAGARAGAELTVRVDARDFSFKLSRRAVPAGSTVRFAVRNRGTSRHRFVVNGKRTRALSRGTSQTISVRFPRKGSFRFLCTIGNHARRGMNGTFTVNAAPPPAPQPPPEEPPVDVATAATLTSIGSFVRPVLVTAPPGDDRIFVVEQSGAVRVVRGGQVLPRPFLDLRERVKFSGESGLLSIAFAPDYAQSGLVYAFYNQRGGFGDIRIAEFRRDASDPDVLEPSSERVLLTIPEPADDHNGGMLQFGPDGYLYASVGDGDPGVLNPPGIFAQRLDLLLGTILRIDPRGGDPYAIPPDNPFAGSSDARPEIWAYGLRNPWRFWIDHETGAMFIADVGSTAREEINLAAAGRSGQNYGWPCFEGTIQLESPPVTCQDPVPPLLDFARSDGVCAVIGGLVARDARIAALAGRYLYGDLCTGKITAVQIRNGEVVRSDALDLLVRGLSSFGVDGSRRIYATAVGGEVFRLDPRPPG